MLQGKILFKCIFKILFFRNELMDYFPYTILPTMLLLISTPNHKLDIQAEQVRYLPKTKFYNAQEFRTTVMIQGSKNHVLDSCLAKDFTSS